jgi:hypothetical protein
MTTTGELYAAVRDAWASIPAPPAEDLKYMAWGWGEEAARAFSGIAPVDVDIGSRGFYAATPLLDLPPRAAAAYLGTFVMSLLKGIEFQQASGIVDDVLSRAHTLTALTLPGFWERVIRPWLPPECHQALRQVVSLLASDRELLALPPEKVDAMLALAAQS